MGDGTEENPYTREDVLKLIEENGGKTEGFDLSEKFFERGVDLSGLELNGIIFRESVFHVLFGHEKANGARFDGSELKRADFRNAELEYAQFNNLETKSTNLLAADFRGSHLMLSSFRGADLANAQFGETEDKNVTVATLDMVDLREAKLLRTNFKGCYFYGTKFEGAFIRGADIFDAHLEEADWGNYKIGEESKKEELYFAENIYRGLKIWYTTAGMYDVAGKFFYREKEARRKALSWKTKPFYKLWHSALRLLCGYGEQWWRVVGWAATVVVGLAVIYYLWGSFSSSSFWDTLYYSAASFTALGYGSWAPQPTGWAKGMGAAEAFIGVFSMALFLVTFTRKMTR
jgi:uncharacterized protein YjbI with pentapeptide repeats